MNKTIVVGVGGTGLEVLRELRKLIVENYGSLDATEVNTLGFFYIDTDDNAVTISEDNKSRWEYLGKPIILNKSEYIILKAPAVAEVIGEIDDYPQVKEWLPKEDLVKINMHAEDTPGAKQVRPLGRYILTMSRNELESAFIGKYNSINQPLEGGTTQIYVACSLSGGTGSGMFLDMAYLIREWTQGENPNMFGFLVLPENPTNRGRRYLANAYAALLELNYYSVSQRKKIGDLEQIEFISFKLPGRPKVIKGPPFDGCYLVGTRNDTGVDIDIHAVPSMIAHRIFLNFDASAVSTDIRSHLDNAKPRMGHVLEDNFNGNLHSQNFLTFGLSSIQYPTEQFLNVIAYRIAKKILDEWHREKNYPGDINTKVQGYLPILKLSDDYLLGDKDFFGDKHFESVQSDVDKMINDLIQHHPAKNMAPYLAQQYNNKEAAFRDVGIKDFYTNKKKNLDGAIREAYRGLRRRISLDLIDSSLGYEYCIKVIEEMIRVFEEKHKAFIDMSQGQPAREANSKKTLDNFLSKLTANEGKLFFREKAIKESMDEISKAMKKHLTEKINAWAYGFSIAFIAKFIEEMKTIKEDLRKWREYVTKTIGELESEITKRITAVEKKIENVKEFNGTLLFSSSQIDTLYNNLKIETAIPFVQDEIFRDNDREPIDLPRYRDLIDSLYRASLAWLQEVSVERISETNVADRLVKEYPDETTRRALISGNFNKATPFVMIDKAQLRRGFGQEGYSLTDGNTSGRIVGIMDPVRIREPRNLNLVLEDLKRATLIEHPSYITDIHQILFLHEYAGFPLRIMKNVSFLKEQYQEYLQAGEIPLHIARSFDPPLYDLFLASAEEKMEILKAEEHYLLGRAFGVLSYTRNERQGIFEVNHAYKELGILKSRVLGGTWEEALSNLLKDDSTMQSSRELLKEEFEIFLKKIDSKGKRDALYFHLDDLMVKIREDLEWGERNPLYKRYDDIRTRIVATNNLYQKREPPMATNRSWLQEIKDYLGIEDRRGQTATSKDATSVPEKFEEAVIKILRCSKDGKISSKLEGVVETSRQRYNVDAATAQEVIAKIRLELFGSQNGTEYEALFSVIVKSTDVQNRDQISEDDRASLLEKQLELDLSDEEVIKIEKKYLRKGSE